jgi:hypothetical protein
LIAASRVEGRNGRSEHKNYKGAKGLEVLQQEFLKLDNNLDPAGCSMKEEQEAANIRK